jgi:hypothetical protein
LEDNFTEIVREIRFFSPTLLHNAKNFIIFAATFEANHNKDYSVVKTFRSHRPLAVAFFLRRVEQIQGKDNTFSLKWYRQADGTYPPAQICP